MSEWDAIGLELAEAGVSETKVLRSTGIAEHRKRFEQGQVQAETLRRYAADLRRLRDATNAQGIALPADFWDVGSPAMQAAGIDEYTLAQTLSGAEYRPYIDFLCRCFQHFFYFQRYSPPTSVRTALNLLVESADYVAAGYALTMTATRPNLRPHQQAIFLWQQIVTGTNREIPYTHREAYTHGIWGRFNVVEMFQYAQGNEISVDDLWGLSGFDARFIRDATNTNQIEHMAITALAQIVLGLPLLFLNLLEDAEWMLRKGTYAASQADKALNRAVAHHFVSLFDVDNPQPACASLEQVLAGRRPGI